MEKNDIEKFYDSFAERQTKVGINARHISISKWIKYFKIKPESHVLEIGCGVGTLTKLLIKQINSKGTLDALDLSAKNIEIAKSNFKRDKNVFFYHADILDDSIDKQYDLIVLADVIEHIPLELHGKLFNILKNRLKKNGNIVINIPDPYSLEYKLKTKKRLQIIDQPVYLDKLSKNLISNNLKITFLKTYSVWLEAGDYQIIKVKHIDPEEYEKSDIIKPGYKRKIIDKIKKELKPISQKKH